MGKIISKYLTHMLTLLPVCFRGYACTFSFLTISFSLLFSLVAMMCRILDRDSPDDAPGERTRNHRPWNWFLTFPFYNVHSLTFSGQNLEKKYNYDYYMDVVEKIVKMGAHVIGIKDMAGVLKPAAATKLVGGIREKYPDIPIHVHTHDSAGTGVASMVACAYAGADAVDACTDSMSGTTSQPSINAILASLEGTDFDPGLQNQMVRQLDAYWAQVRLYYSGFEAGLVGPDPEVYEHEIPGGQLTNLIFQCAQQGLGSQWALTKKKYEEANDLLGDIVKVTPTSKVVGDLAQFMVSNELSYQDTLDKAQELDFPSSVLEFFEGLMGQPYGGFPEPFRSNVLRDRRKMDKRPGEYLEPINFDEVRKHIKENYGKCTECDVASYVMYSKVFEDYKTFVGTYGDLSVLPTRYFLNKPEIGEEFHVELEKGKVLILKLLAVGPLSEQTGQREVFFELNGEIRQVAITDHNASIENKQRPKADTNDSSQVGAPMAGVVIEVRVKDGGEVNKGDPIAILSAMKMVCPCRSHELLITDSVNRKWLSVRLILAKSHSSAFEMVTPLTVKTSYARLAKGATVVVKASRRERRMVRKRRARGKRSRSNRLSSASFRGVG